MRLAVEYDRRVRKLRKAFLRARQPQSPLGGPRSPAAARTPFAAAATSRPTPLRTRDLLLLAVSILVLLHAIQCRLDRRYRPLEHWRRGGSGVSVILACRNLVDLEASVSSLPQTTPSVVAAVPQEPKLPSNLRKVVRGIPIATATTWRAPAAINVAASRAYGEWLMLIPCGCHVPELPTVLNSDVVYVRRRAASYDKCSHTALITKNAYFSARGLDERGTIDIDRAFVARALHVGMKVRYMLDVNISSHFDPVAATRIAADELLQDGVPAWSVHDDEDNSTYHQLSRRDGVYTVSRGVHQAARSAIPFEELISHRGGETAEEVRTLANATGGRNVLHARYHLPQSLTVGMTPTVVARLLQSLADAENARFHTLLKQHAASGILLNAARKLAGSPELRPRLLVIEPMHGLGNRLRALASARALARSTGRILIVVWARDAHCLATWDALLASDELHDVYVTSVPTRWPLSARDDAAWERWDVIDYMDDSQKDSSLRARSSPNHILVRSAYALHADPVSDATWAATNDELRALPPSAAVAGLVRAAEAAAGTSGVRSAVGVHVRARAVKGEVAGASYGTNGTLLLNYWRAKAAPEAFVAEMRCGSENANAVSYVVAADSEPARQMLRNACPSATVLRGCDDRTEQCVLQAYAELLLLARTKQLLASPWSSFSEVASRIGGIRMRVAGVDFAADNPDEVRSIWGESTANVVSEVQRRRRLKRTRRARMRFR